MYWSIAAVSATGLLIGLRFRAPALIAATAVTLVACGFAFGSDGVVGRRDIFSVFAIVLALQLAYLAGLFLAVVWPRSTPPANKSGG